MATKQLSFPIVLAFVCAVALTGVTAQAQQCPVNQFASGLKAPVKLILSTQGNLFIAETGDGLNTGRISIVDFNGSRRTLLDGLPAGVNAVGELSGPSALLLRGRTLYVAIGEGDTTLPGPIPGATQIGNPAPSSPIFNSVLALRLSAHTERATQGFTLTSADHVALDSGQRLTLRDGAGNKLNAELVVDFPDFVPQPLPFFAGNVRNSNPFGLQSDCDSLYVVDAGLNSVVEVDIRSGSFETLTEFAPLPNPLPFGPPVSDAVPDSIRQFGDQLLVTLLTGFPFAPGVAQVRAVDLKTGDNRPFITGLTSAIDVLPLKTRGDKRPFLTLEFSADLLAGSPGRLQRFAAPGAAPTLIADCLITPTSMARDPQSGTLFVAELATGRIVTIDIAR